MNGRQRISGQGRIGEAVQTCRIDIELAVIKGDRWFVGVCEELSADNLEFLQIEVFTHLNQFFFIIQNRQLIKKRV